jgi:hypothetical protein
VDAGEVAGSGFAGMVWDEIGRAKTAISKLAANLNGNTLRMIVCGRL